MNVFDALHATAHDPQHGGTDVLAERLGMKSGAMLRNKTNPNNTDHHIRLDETLRLMGITGDYRVLKAIAYEHGFVCIPLPATTTMPPSQTSFFDRLLNIVHHKGNVCKTLKDAMADGRITPGEVLDMKSAISGLQQELASLSAEFESACPNFKEKTDV